MIKINTTLSSDNTDNYDPRIAERTISEVSKVMAHHVKENPKKYADISKIDVEVVSRLEFVGRKDQRMTAVNVTPYDLDGNPLKSEYAHLTFDKDFVEKL